MRLIDDIVDAASTDNTSVSELLRKGLVLAHRLKNATLKKWVTSELNGYDREEDAPDYRRISAIAKGHFHGAFGASISNIALPAAALKGEHKKFCKSVVLTQPIAAYAPNKDDDGSVANGRIEWPPDLILHYSRAFYKGYALAAAWQELPYSVIMGLNDTVKTKLLQIALDLQDELGISGKGDIADIPKTKVEPIVSYHIYGGNNVITGQARDVSQSNKTTVSRDDFESLSKALSALGVPVAGMSDLRQSMQEDGKGGAPAMGTKVQGWLTGVGRLLGPSAMEVATKAVEGYLGLS